MLELSCCKCSELPNVAFSSVVVSDGISSQPTVIRGEGYGVDSNSDTFTCLPMTLVNTHGRVTHSCVFKI